MTAQGWRPPAHFRWRPMRLTGAQVSGSERTCPEWWRDDQVWRGGVRDYWRGQTREDQRL